VSAAPLVTALNDRLRRINTALDATSDTTAAAAPILYGTHAQRVGRPVPADATIYIETDRNGVAYQVRGTGYVWLFGAWCQTQAQIAALASTLALADTGFLAYSTDGLLLYRWSGTAFVRQDDYSPVIVDTHAARLSAYPSTRYAVGQEFWESDRAVKYMAQNCAGTVNTSGTAATWVSGNKFSTLWTAGTVITINGTAYTVSIVTDPTHVTLNTSAGANSGVAYSVASGRWAYVSETMQQAWANLPADLGDADAGLLFYDVNSLHTWQWNGSAWGWGPGNRASGEMAEFDADPGAGWHLCDGTGGVTKYAANGTRSTTFTVPDRRGFYTEGSGSYTGLGVAVVPATVNTTAGTAGTGSGAVLTAASIGTQPVPPTFATLYYYRL
jgi:hypothetical protein